MKTTLKKIKEHELCKDGWEKLLKHLGKKEGDDEPLDITTILDSNGLDDAIWCLRAVDGHEREMRLFSVWCARQVQHLMTDRQSIKAVDVAERYANGLATETERTTAWAAEAAAWAAAGVAAGAAVWAADATARAARAARAAARAGVVARAAVWATVWAADATARAAKAAGAAKAAAWAAGAARDAARAAEITAWAAARAAAGNATAWASQEVEFRRICTSTKGVQDDTR